VVKLLSIVVPVYNEEANVEPLYELVNRTLERIADRYRWEFVFTDNCSEDRTFERLERLAAADARIRVYRFARNFGFQRSILTGYRLARGDAAVQIDCDLQDPPELILDFVRLWEAGSKVVYGMRRSRPEPVLLHTMRRFFYRAITWISDDNLPVDAGDFRLIDRCVLDLLYLYRDENPYLRGYIATLGYEQTAVGYDRAERKRGKTSFNLGNLVRLAIDGIVSHSTLPLRISSFIGLALSLLATLAIAVYVVLWFSYEQSWPAGFATLAILMLLSLAINSIFLGIIGEYVARIYSQVRPRPLTIVERVIDRTEPPVRGSETRAVDVVEGIAMPTGEAARESPARRRRVSFDEQAENYQQTVGRAAVGVSVEKLAGEKARIILEILARDIGDPRCLHVLDVGCGIGLVDRDLSSNVTELCGVDTSLRSIEIARERVPGARFLHYDGSTLPVASSSFDGAFASCVLHHVPPPARPGFLAEMLRALRPGGAIILIEHNPFNPVTQWIVSRCAFDADAILLSCREAMCLMAGAGTVVGGRRYVGFSPFRTALIERAERAIGCLPIGAQYCVWGVKT
jgi:dolichol-phosphate mannosyltransferase